jgi:VWFA-related protein
MRRCLPFLAILPLFAALPVAGQEGASVQYEVVIDKIQTVMRTREGERGRFITVQFRLQRAGSNELATDVTDDIIVLEDGRPAAGIELHRPKANALTTILALDISGSMAKSDKIDQAKKAANLFLDRLSDRADCGLILFNHDVVRPLIAPCRDPQRFLEHREQIRAAINAAQPRGGTAYIDATAEAVRLLEGVQGRKAIVVMTDGVDLNSKHRLEQVIDLAKAAEVPVYTLGVGEPGKNEPVSTVLVLDRSNSMGGAAGGGKTKLQAAQEAAGRFIDIMRPGAQATFTAFADIVDRPGPFTGDKADLKKRVNSVKMHVKTLFFEGAYQGVATLAKENPEGKKAVIVLTDGLDTTGAVGLKRMEETIQLAKKHQIVVYPFGFGARVNDTAMARMARETGGQFYRPRDGQALIELYEGLSIQLHDDGIDERSLKKLAEDTGGRYFPARNVEDLKLIYEQVAEELQTTYTVTFPSWRPENDGTASRVEIVVVRGGQRVSNVARDTFMREGVVLAESHPGVYLALLFALVGLLALPRGLRQFYGSR